MAAKVKFEVRGVVAGYGIRTHVIRAANTDLARGKFRLAYDGHEVRDLVALTPEEVEAEKWLLAKLVSEARAPRKSKVAA